MAVLFPFPSGTRTLAIALGVATGTLLSAALLAQSESTSASSEAPARVASSSVPPIGSEPYKSENARKAWQILEASIQRLVSTGPPFEARLRQVSRVDGQDVRAVGRYVQSSKLKGLMRMELQSSVDNQTCRFEQTSDGRLVWTREQVGDDIRTRRVDIGRLDELALVSGVSPRFKVGGLPELLDSIAWDFDLTLVRGTLKAEQPVWIIRGTMKPERLKTLLETNKLKEVPPHLPTMVRVALTLGGPFELLPVRIEFSGKSVGPVPGPPRLISELDLYEFSVIDDPQEQLFRYNTSEEDAHFTNETQIYVDRYQSRLAELPSHGSDAALRR